MMLRPDKIISGGQTGADRAALDAAITLGIPHGGFCPKGRRSEDGTIPDKYLLTETKSASYPIRTELNITTSDGTAIFTMGPLEQESGCALTVRLCKKHWKPTMLVDVSRVEDDRIVTMLHVLVESGVKVLNVAGSRESKATGIYTKVRRLIETAFGGPGYDGTDGQESNRKGLP
jgi:predicted Rossmann-fold nucleotide-binding protein